MSTDGSIGKGPATLRALGPAATAEQDDPKYGAANAFGNTFVIAPSWSLRLGADDAVIFVPMLQTTGFAMLMVSELQLRAADANWVFEVAPTTCADANRVYHEDNAGGASSISEAPIFE